MQTVLFIDRLVLLTELGLLRDLVTDESEDSWQELQQGVAATQQVSNLLKTPYDGRPTPSER